MSKGLERWEAERVEKALAIARVILATSSALAIYIDPTLPSRYPVFTYFVLTTYTLWSFGLLFFPSFVFSHRIIPVVVQSMDVLWVSVLIAGTDGAASPFFLFYMFALIAAAYRGDLWDSAWNGVLLVLVFLVLS